ncbi:alanine--tRNA ligase, partial [bacterium]
MTANEIRQKYLEFFRSKGHTIIPSAPLVPENDPTTLFTGSGMQQLIPYLLGEKHPGGDKIADSQKCFRAEDIEEVGDNRHTTFFEMLGNWSLGDYFKREQLAWLFEFLTENVGLDPKKLYVTVLSGDEKNKIPKDHESVEIWKKLFAGKDIEAKDIEFESLGAASQKGMQDGRIFYYDVTKNWWSRSGVPDDMPPGEPGGPDSEIFYDFGTLHDEKFGKHCHPNCDCGRFMEIGNSVFMEYKKTENGSFELLAQKNVDFGGGLERVAAASIGANDIFQIDTFADTIKKIEQLSSFKYGQENTKSFRVIADHIRGAVFMISEDILPSNTGRGYVARRLIRRSIRHADLLQMKEDTLKDLTDSVIEKYQEVYPDVLKKQGMIKSKISEEEAKFRKTLKKGLKEFEKMEQVDGKKAFDLFQTYGFPLELTVDLATERGISINKKEFEAEFKKHQELSRTSSAGTFKGGLADHSERTTRLHTATHLLQAGMRHVLG